MRHQDLTPEELAQFAENIKKLLAGTDLSAIDAAKRAELLTRIGTLPEVLTSQIAEYFVSKAETKAKLSERNATAEVLNQMLDTVKVYLIAGDAPEDQFDKCSFDFPTKKRVRVVANIPSDLAVEGFSNQMNKGRFEGNNKTGTVVYEVFRCEADGGEWLFRLQTGKQSFTDEDVTPGHVYRYKVRALRSQEQIRVLERGHCVWGLVVVGGKQLAVGSGSWQWPVCGPES